MSVDSGPEMTGHKLDLLITTHTSREEQLERISE
jgi:hypothetical protein